MSLLLAMLAVTAACAPDPSLADAGPQRVRAYFAAVNSRDEAAIGRFIKPGAVYSNPEADGLPLAEVMAQVAELPAEFRLEVVETTVRDGAVFVRTRAIDGSPATATVWLEGGCVIRFVQN
jgi:hypothetical protein